VDRRRADDVVAGSGADRAGEVRAQQGVARIRTLLLASVLPGAHRPRRSPPQLRWPRGGSCGRDCAEERGPCPIPGGGEDPTPLLLLLVVVRCAHAEADCSAAMAPAADCWARGGGERSRLMAEEGSASVGGGGLARRGEERSARHWESGRGINEEREMSFSPF
jgi:hypothetical protein